jgi:hypothetical protein
MTVNCRRILDARLVCYPRWLVSITETDSTLVLAFRSGFECGQSGAVLLASGRVTVVTSVTTLWEGVLDLWSDTCVFSRVYGVSPRGCCGFVVTAVTGHDAHDGPLRAYSKLDFSHLSQTGGVAHRPSARREAVSSRLHTQLCDVGDQARRAAPRKGPLREFWPDLPGRLAASFCHCVPFCYSCA